MRLAAIVALSIATAVPCCLRAAEPIHEANALLIQTATEVALYRLNGCVNHFRRSSNPSWKNVLLSRCRTRNLRRSLKPITSPSWQIQTRSPFGYFQERQNRIGQGREARRQVLGL